MAKPLKQRDRQRPFLKVDPHPADESIDGEAVARGCFPPSFFGDFDQGAIDTLTQNIPALGLLHDAIQKARQAVAIAKPIIRALMIAQAIGLLGGAGIPGFLLAIAVIALIEEIISTTQDVLDIIEKKIIGRFAKRILPRACRVMPHWVPVKRDASNIKVEEEQIVEVQGIVSQSYQSPTDVPFFQWHRWYNWSIHVKPDKGFEKCLSPAPNPPTNAKRNPGEEPIQQPGTIECQWDIGSFFADQTQFEAELGPGHEDLRSGPMARFDWAWPMPGQFVWASGRWAYDCSRSTSDDGFGKMATVLNPVKAFATARLEGFKFAENERAVPATQFMFFATRRGGYINHDRINDQDYEFIVDLPELEDAPTDPFPIGRTEKFEPDFDHNTLVIRPRLLMHVNSGAFAITGSKSIDPIVEMIPPEKGKPPTHVRVRVPMTQFGPTEQAFGFVLSLGWYDETGVEAAKVREISVNVDRLEGSRENVRRDKPDEITKLVKEAEAEIADEAKKKVRKDITDALGDTLGGIASTVVEGLIDFFVKEVVDTFLTAFTGALEDLLASQEEWLIHVGVNGRYTPFRFDFKGGRQIFSKEVKFFLPTTEPVRVSMSGVDFDPVGDIMRESRKDRGLDLDNSEVPWEFIVRPPGSGEQALAIRKRLITRYVFKLLGTLGDDNDPTSFVEEKHLGLGEGRHDGFFLNVFFTRALDDQRTYVVDQLTPTSDHALFYSIEIKEQPPLE